MKQKLLILFCLSFLLIQQAFSQSRTISGLVTAKDDGLAVPGATVKIKGTTLGTQTNSEGKYSISVAAGGVLVFSFLGYEAQEITPTGPIVNVTLITSSKVLGEVVVTGALGIKKQEKEVGYATTRITGANANETSVIDPLNGLTAKVAGLVIQQTNDGIDPTLKVNLRGNRSLLGYNGALFILDGVPVAPEIIESLNPNDIEDYNVLNGSGAAALYGSEASNGAIVITTKRGTSNGKPTVTYSNTIQLQQAAVWPDLQTQYGQYGGEAEPFLNPITGFAEQVPFENELWGPAFNGQTVQVGAFPAGSPNGPILDVPYSSTGKSPVKSFFQTGVTEQNDLSFSQGDAKNSVYFGIRQSSTRGITPGDSSQQVAAHLAITKTVGIFRADLSTNFTRNTISTNAGVDWNPGAEPGYNTLFANVMQFPANLNINAPYFKDVNNPNSFGYASNYFSAYSTNPWWTIEDTRVNTQRDIFSGNLNMTLTPSKWLDISYRVSDAFGSLQQKLTADPVNFLAFEANSPTAESNYFSISSYPNGIPGRTSDIVGYGDGTASIVNTAGTVPNFNGPEGLARLQGDALLNFHRTFFNNLKTSLLLGNTIWEEHMDYTYDYTASLVSPGFNNVNYSSGSPYLYQATATIRQISFYGDFNINYKGFANVEATLRNDQDSRLDPAHNSFLYPSLKGTFIPTDAFPGIKGNVLGYAKLYADVSRVGQVSLPPYNINPTFTTSSGFPFGNLDAFGTSGINYPPGLKPEQISEFEFGAELGLFNDRLDIKGDYYTQTSRNQTLSITTSPATGYNSSVINAGEIQSNGEEFSITGVIVPKTSNAFGWNVGANFAINNSKVVSLVNGENEIQLSTNLYGGVFAVVGKSYPQLEVGDYLRDPQGQVIVNPATGTGTPSGALTDEGRTTPKYNLGINTSFSYRFMTLSIVAEYRGGDVIFNGIGPVMTFAGDDAFSSQAGRQIFVIPNSVINTGTAANPVYVKNTTVPVPAGGLDYWVDNAGAPSGYGVGSTYVTSAAFWKIREVALDFNLNKLVKNNKYIKGLSLGVNARNLLTFLPKTEMWGDPEQDAAGTGNAVGTNGTTLLPSTRYYGAKLQVTF